MNCHPSLRKGKSEAVRDNRKISDTCIRSAKPKTTVVKLSDGGGLQLWISPEGAKRWRLAYRFNAKQNVLALGLYPSSES